jgi:predicted DNA-binding protein
MTGQTQPEQTNSRRLDATIGFSIGQAERDRIAQLAASHGRTVAAEVRHAIRYYLNALDEADRR